MNREVELKLELAPDAADAFGRLDWFPADSDVATLRSIYFDTAQRDLAGRGISLRIRRANGQRVQTVKADGEGGAGLFARAEWEMPVADDAPVLDARTPIAELLGQGVHGIQPVFHAEVERRRWIVRQDDALIELVLDRGQVSAGDRQAAICEVELELKSGSPGALFLLARRIDAEMPVRPGVLTKAERGYRLRDRLAAFVKAEPVALDPSMRAEEALSRIAGSCLRHYRLNEALLLDHYDPGALHQARVAIRRLRSALSLFRPMLAPADVERFQGELKWLAAMLGEARNLDVLAERVETEELRERWDAVRGEVHGRVQEWLRSARVRMLLIDLVEWLTLGAGLGGGKALAMRDEPAADFAARRLRRLRRRIAKEGRGLAGLSDEARHEVRKDAKKLRYASEFFAGLFEGRKARRRRGKFIAALEQVQSELGALNDLVAAPGLLAHYGLGGEEARLRPKRKRKRKLLGAAARAHEDLLEAPRFWR
ncbi:MULTISPECIES: CYTH and CHAD domain-containing protein [Sphingobium]|uniref:Inorganic triphosphatase n=1 Tax=Sphingobium fuliginis (strain ATCC 27551) TaxID=336203 RepID=A0ABQ1FE42_SPHSA|nr:MULTISPECIES: CYTH and CHAD domain-containing protein [Sphingobium]AJR24880.1 ceramide glucosyltransferase [Sphingobium sp. YBL2]RYL95565.1 CYTH and CHAD domain-containing protein [Sphingobium fuliginis]WDA37069.1 CYTH and CHAD domain-containing protein [Sphingobium sp. YC-XJ3]GGA06636.1 inorganic triphosphatase [Sphingobium fuliginis]